MSGGIDSTVTAFLLKEEGYEVIGVSLWLYDNITFKRSCCSIEAINKAKIFSKKLGIRHYLLDEREYFRDTVIRFFVEGYKNALTPNACVLCNRIIKFQILNDFREKVGADYYATGHYAVLEDGKIKRAFDREKDQSYFLCLLEKKNLERLMFPLGKMKKTQVIEIGSKNNLFDTILVESQDLCFVDNGNYREFLRKNLGNGDSFRGPILSEEGEILGWHDGYFNFTLGQRKGLGVALGKRAYVVEIRRTGEVIVGNREKLLKRRVKVGSLNLLEELDMSKTYLGMVRYGMEPKELRILDLKDDILLVEFFEDVWNPTPGQVLALYDRDVLVGGGFIVPDQNDA